MQQLKDQTPDLVLVGGKYIGVEGMMGGQGGSMPYGPCPNGYRCQCVAGGTRRSSRRSGRSRPSSGGVLRRHICQFFGTQVILQIKNPTSGGWVTMDSQERLRKAVARAQTIGEQST